MSAERGKPSFSEDSSYFSEINKVKEQIDFAESLHEFNDPENNLSELSERIENGAYPIIYSNHTQHINIAALRGIYNRLSVRPDNFYIPVASSLGQGSQSEGLGSFANSLESIMKGENVHFIPLARPKDMKEYYRYMSKEERKEIINETKSNKARLIDSVAEDAGLLIFPETTTEGAIKDKNGKRKGLQEVEIDLFSEFLKRGEEIGRDIAFLPTGIIDANKIIEPRETDPTLRTKFQYAKSRMGLKPAQLAKVNIGRPVSSFDLGEEGIDFQDVGKVNDFMMRRVADLLPEEARGYYR